MINFISNSEMVYVKKCIVCDMPKDVSFIDYPYCSINCRRKYTIVKNRDIIFNEIKRDREEKIILTEKIDNRYQQLNKSYKKMLEIKKSTENERRNKKQIEEQKFIQRTLKDILLVYENKRTEHQKNIDRLMAYIKEHL